MAREGSRVAGVVLAVALGFACAQSSSIDSDAGGLSWEEARAGATTTAVDGYEIRYRRGARKGAPSVVLFGPYPQSIRAWDAAWPALASRYDVLAMDLPGFGLSEGAPETMSPSAAGKIALRLLDQQGIEEFHVVGPDVGAPVALWLAAHHPERVLSANVFDGPGYYPPVMAPDLERLVNSGLARWLAANVVTGSAMERFYVIATKAGYAVAEPSAEAAAEYHAITHHPTSHRLGLAYLASYEEELTALGERLPQITRPVLVTWGSEDAFVLPENAEQLGERLPASQLVLFENAGHYSHEDAGDRYVEVLTRWIDGGYLETASRDSGVEESVSSAS